MRYVYLLIRRSLINNGNVINAACLIWVHFCAIVCMSSVCYTLSCNQWFGCLLLLSLLVGQQLSLSVLTQAQNCDITETQNSSFIDAHTNTVDVMEISALD